MTSELIISGGAVLEPSGSFVPLDIVIRDGVIAELLDGSAARLTPHADTVDASGLLVTPGFIDLQINGGWGHDFTHDPASITTVAEQLPQTGVTSFCPTIVSSTRARREAALTALGRITQREPFAQAVGLHFEGPAISADRAGAHDTDQIGPIADDELARWSRHAGVAMVTLAPEVPQAGAMIDTLVADGVVVSAGHTDCSADTFACALARGVTMVTHLFNAMAPFSHRAPGPVGATLADATVRAGLICDGLHVDPTAVRAAWRSLGPDRVILVTDAMAALGSSAGTLRLGDVTTTVDETGVRTEAGLLAGSNLSLDHAVRNLIQFTECSMAEAIATVTSNPADLLGLDDRGHLEIGERADIVLLGTDLVVRRTIIAGQTVWSS